MRAALVMAVAMLGLAGTMPTAAQTSGTQLAQTDQRRPPRVIIVPRQAPADPYPLPGAAFPGPGYVRDCVAFYVEDPRPSGTVIVPRMRCGWVRGRA